MDTFDFMLHFSGHVTLLLSYLWLFVPDVNADLRDALRLASLLLHAAADSHLLHGIPCLAER